MATKCMVTDATAMNATETTKTKIGSINVPVGAKRIVGAALQFLAGTAGLTTLENVGGIFSLESTNMTSPWLGNQEFLTGAVVCLTSGTANVPPYVHACDIPVQSNGTVDIYATMDLATTVNNKCRGMLVFEF